MIDNDLEGGPISMQALGQEDLSDSLLGALNTPRVPDAVIAQLLSQGPSFGQRMAQAAAGGVAAMRGQANPVTSILAGQQQERVSLATMLQKMNAQADLKDYRNQGLLLKREELQDRRSARDQAVLKGAVDLSMSILNNPNAPDSAVVLAQDNLRNFAPKLYPGFQVPESIIQRRATQEDLKSAMTDVFLNSVRGPDGKFTITPEGIATVSKRHPRFTPQEIPGLADTLNRDDVQKFMGMKTTAELEKDAIELEIKKRQLADEALPMEWRGNPAAVRELSAIASTEFPGVAFNELSKEQLSTVSGIFDRKKEAENLRKKEAENDMRLQSTLASIQARGDVQLANALAKLDATSQPKPAKWGDIRKVQQDFGFLANGVRALQQLRTDLAKIPDDALPAGDDFVSMLLASMKRRLLYPGQESNFAVQQRYFEIMKGVFERGFLNAKGTQSVKTDLAQLEALNNMPSRKTMDQYIKSAQDMIQESLTNNLTTLENSDATPREILETAKDIVSRISPKNPQVKPGPLKPEPIQVKKKLKRISDGKERTWVGAIGEPIPPGYMEIE